MASRDILAPRRTTPIVRGVCLDQVTVEGVELGERPPLRAKEPGLCLFEPTSPAEVSVHISRSKSQLVVHVDAATKEQAVEEAYARLRRISTCAAIRLLDAIIYLTANADSRGQLDVSLSEVLDLMGYRRARMVKGQRYHDTRQLQRLRGILGDMSAVEVAFIKKRETSTQAPLVRATSIDPYQPHRLTLRPHPQLLVDVYAFGVSYFALVHFLKMLDTPAYSVLRAVVRSVSLRARSTGFQGQTETRVTVAIDQLAAESGLPRADSPLVPTVAPGRLWRQVDARVNKLYEAGLIYDVEPVRDGRLTVVLRRKKVNLKWVVGV